MSKTRRTSKHRRTRKHMRTSKHRRTSKTVKYGGKSSYRKALIEQKKYEIIKSDINCNDENLEEKITNLKNQLSKWGVLNKNRKKLQLKALEECYTAKMIQEKQPFEPIIPPSHKSISYSKFSKGSYRKKKRNISGPYNRLSKNTRKGRELPALPIIPPPPLTIGSKISSSHTSSDSLSYDPTLFEK